MRQKLYLIILSVLPFILSGQFGSDFKSEVIQDSGEEGFRVASTQGYANININGENNAAAIDFSIDDSLFWFFFVDEFEDHDFIITSNNNINDNPIITIDQISGDVDFSGKISKGGGSFKIDHPLDPKNKFLYHSFVESPDMMNVYNGNIITDENGLAIVTLPKYFEALNKEFRYQLTVIQKFAQAIIKEKVKDNTFLIATDEPQTEVSWQITGIRKDPFANSNRIQTEVNKSKKEQGKYLHPAAFGTMNVKVNKSNNDERKHYGHN